ncbi:MYG1 family protein [Acetobacteraceae bacterium H6797]|nr:MYG1 family protein [Acetobacteraceae bacterium H6797]
MLPTDRPLVLATHSGTFHADDVLAYSILSVALGLTDPASHKLIRTRDKEALATADIVWDVGGTADAATWRFDHHQQGAPKAENGDPLSSAGLVWRHLHPETGETIGAMFIRNTLKRLGHGETVFSASAIGIMASAIGKKIVRHVDLCDNGVERGLPTDLTSAIDGFNAAWDSPTQTSPELFEASQYSQFLEAKAFTLGFLDRQVERERASVAAYEMVAQAWEDCKAGKTGLHPDVLELPRGMPWLRPAFELDMPILYAMSPEANGHWKLQCMPVEKGSFENRLDLPLEWAGLADEELQKASGIPDAIFVHRNRFMAVAKSRDGALAIARAALARKLTPAQMLKQALERRR